MTTQVHRANLETVTVDVRLLQVGGKQMTLSVFRQLQSEEAFDFHAREPKGQLWGLVNYTWKGCMGQRLDINCPDHQHVVWQWGDELLRSCVPLPGPTFDHYHYPYGAFIPQLMRDEAHKLGADTDNYGTAARRELYEELERGWPRIFDLEDFEKNRYGKLKEQITKLSAKTRQAYDDFRVEVYTMPQLFIAV